MPAWGRIFKRATGSRAAKPGRLYAQKGAFEDGSACPKSGMCRIATLATIAARNGQPGRTRKAVLYRDVSNRAPGLSRLFAYRIASANLVRDLQGCNFSCLASISMYLAMRFARVSARFAVCTCQRTAYRLAPSSVEKKVFAFKLPSRAA